MLPSPAELLQNLKTALSQTPLASSAACIPSLPTLDDAQLQIMLHSVLQKCQLVPRAEFDAQTAVLLATRTRMEQLEQKIAQLEAEKTPPSLADGH